MKKLLLLSLMMTPAITIKGSDEFVKQINITISRALEQKVGVNPPFVVSLLTNSAAIAAGCAGPALTAMDWAQLAQDTNNALGKLSDTTKSIAAENPKATALVIGGGALSCFVYKGLSYLSTVDPKTAGSGVLMAYGALHALKDIKNVLQKAVSHVEKQEIELTTALQSNLKSEDFEYVCKDTAEAYAHFFDEAPSYSSAEPRFIYTQFGILSPLKPVPDMECPGLKKETKTSIFEQLQQNRLQARLTIVEHTQND
jgi:hypothetical protein